MTSDDAVRRADGAPARPVPSPAALRGRTDPARRVRPVDFAATGANPSGAAPAGADPAGDQASRPARRRVRTYSLPRPASPAPDGAVHTLGTDDAPHALRPLRIDEGEVRAIGVDAIDRERAVEAVADPDEAWTSDNGVSDHFCRGGLVVQVRRADNAVIGVFSRAYALSVRPEHVGEVEGLREIAELAAGRSARRGAGTRVPTTRRELLARLEDRGFVLTPGAGHGRVTHPDHPGLFVPMASTPSDVRFTRYAVAQIRRVFGVDLRV